VAPGATSASFPVSTVAVKKNAAVSITANYAGVTKSAAIKITHR
jgi:hypothetical protein